MVATPFMRYSGMDDGPAVGVAVAVVIVYGC